ncbi:MAG: GatB/YqeY domain-containing protein [Deltaproteobacteria bacterium]|nr:GatB/YqeY domain-containing protein [Deltaproteobacteria bacterium]
MAHSAKEQYGWNQDMQVALHAKLREDLKKSMLSKDVEVRDTMRLIMAEFPKLTVPITLQSGKKTTRLKKPEEITDDDIVGIIKGLVKSEQTVLEVTGKETSEYMQILRNYLPKMVGREEIIAWIQDYIDFSQYKNKMQAIGPVMKHFGKLADGKQVNQILKEWK